MIVAVNDRADQLLSRVEKAVKEASAQNVKVERMGKKQLAYPIKKQVDATYFTLDFEMESEGVKPVSDKLRLEQDDLLRHLLIRVEKKVKKVKKAVEVKEQKEETQKEASEKPKVTVVTKAKVSAKVEKKKVVKAKKATRGKK